MNKPKPKSELIITATVNNVHPHGYLTIRFYSDDARMWIIENAREFSINPELYDSSIFE